MLGQVSPTRADGNQDEQPRAAEAAAVPAQAPGEPQAPAEPQNAAAEQAQVLVPRASNAPARNPRLRIRSQPPVGEPRIILRPTPRYGVDLPQEVIIRFSSDQMHRFFELEQAAGERVGENGPVRARIEQYVEACAHHQPQPIVRAPTNAPAIEYDAGQAAMRVDAVEPMDIAEDNGDAGPGANAAQNGKADKD